MTRPTRNVFLLLATILLAAWVAEGEASAQSYFRLQNKNSGRCLGVNGASTAQNALLSQFTCDSGAGQYWIYDHPDSGFPRIRNLNSQMCIDIPGGNLNPGVQLQQFPCHTGPNQRFSFSLYGWWFGIVSQRSGLCLNVSGASTANGAPVVQSACGPADSQLWIAIP